MQRRVMFRRRAVAAPQSRPPCDGVRWRLPDAGGSRPFIECPFGRAIPRDCLDCPRLTGFCLSTASGVTVVVCKVRR